MTKTTLPTLLFGVVFLLLPAVCLAGEEDDPSPERVLGTKTVSVEEAKALYDRGTVFVDVRVDERYKAGTIPRSVHLDFNTDFTKNELSKYLRKYDEFVVFCDGMYCGLSALAAKKAVRWGFTNIYYFRPGFPGWRRAGYPIEMPKEETKK